MTSIPLRINLKFWRIPYRKIRPSFNNLSANAFPRNVMSVKQISCAMVDCNDTGGSELEYLIRTRLLSNLLISVANKHKSWSFLWDFRIRIFLTKITKNIKIRLLFDAMQQKILYSVQEMVKNYEPTKTLLHRLWMLPSTINLRVLKNLSERILECISKNSALKNPTLFCSMSSSIAYFRHMDPNKIKKKVISDHKFV